MDQDKTGRDKKTPKRRTFLKALERCGTVLGACRASGVSRSAIYEHRAKCKGFAEACLAEYDLNGWRVPDLTDPGELSYHLKSNAQAPV